MKRTKFIAKYSFRCVGCQNKVNEGDIATYSIYEDKQILCEACGDLEDEH